MNIITFLSEKMRPYRTYILIILVLIIFIFVAKYAFETYFLEQNKNKDFSDVANTVSRTSGLQVYFFFVDWCPHCVKAKPEWDSFKRQYDNTVVNGYKVRCYSINCTDDNGDEVIEIDMADGSSTGMKPTSVKTAELIRKYKIDAYPTVKLVKDNVVTDFDSKITKEALAHLL